MNTKNFIQTPYGPKTPELLCRAMDALSFQPRLMEALQACITALRPIEESDRGAKNPATAALEKAHQALERARRI